MLTAVRMVALRVWNCSLEAERMQFQTTEMNRAEQGLKTGGRYEPGRKD